jgi:hypothetical protein
MDRKDDPNDEGTRREGVKIIKLDGEAEVQYILSRM